MVTKKSKRRYLQIYEGEWNRHVWKGYRNQCCDCGMIHVLDYRVIFKGKKIFLEERVRVDRKATAACRSRRGLKVVKTKR